MILVIDVGTTGLRSSLITPGGALAEVCYLPFAPTSPSPGLVEFDPTPLAATIHDSIATALRQAGNPTVDAVGIANQRASTLLWKRSTGEPVGPAIGWQDLRTVGECMVARAEHGLALAPNQSATKLAWLLEHAAVDADADDLCFGTVDTWVAWVISQGERHITDHTNAAVTGLYSLSDQGWNSEVCGTLGIDPAILPDIVDSGGIAGRAHAIPGGPPIAALVGDQQASLVGQGCLSAGQAKITFGTGGMLDVCTGTAAPQAADRSPNGTFPIVAYTQPGTTVWGVEAIMLSAGSNVEWLCEDMGLIDAPPDSHTVASACDTAEGVVFVPALLGLGTPHWDYGARGSLFGLTRGSQRHHVVRAVLEGVAHRGADMVAAAEADTGLSIPALHIDGGMSANPTFVQALANASQKPVRVAPITDATTLGAGLLAGVAVGVWADLDEASSATPHRAEVEPNAAADRAAWERALQRAQGWIPELSALDF